MRISTKLAWTLIAALVLCAAGVAAGASDSAKQKLETSIIDYTIQSGDTLWDISGNFYGDPWMWPLIWEINPYIADPHWIYPDNKLKIRLEQGLMYGLKSGVPDLITPFDWWDPTWYYSTKTNRVDFITNAKFDKAGEIVDEFDDSLLLGEEHEVFFTMDESANVQLGDVFTIFRTREKVKHPDKGGSIGYVIDTLGEIETIKSTTLKSGAVVYTGKIIDSTSEMAVGDKLITMPSEEYSVTLNKTSLDLNGYIVAFQPEQRNFAESDIVFIDLGSKDGVELGNSFSIWRESKNEKRLPGYFMGNLIVIHVEPSNATAIVTNSLKELKVGDTIKSDIQ